MLLLTLPAATPLRVGALGEYLCAPGVYLYTGSAKKNLPLRVARHLAGPGKLRWHIDPLTTPRPLGAVLLPAAAGLTECGLNRAVGELLGNLAPMPRFAAGDCTARCPAHLWQSRRRISPATLARKLAAKGFREARAVLAG